MITSRRKRCRVIADNLAGLIILSFAPAIWQQTQYLELSFPKQQIIVHNNKLYITQFLAVGHSARSEREPWACA